MESFLPVLAGFLSGILYNEHIYQQAVRFPKRSILFSFWVRFLFLSLVMLIVAKTYEERGLLFFLFSTLVARFLHTLLRAFVAVRY